jgi:peptidoglycan/LPS O-acetylase OafA/YrhL
LLRGSIFRQANVLVSLIGILALANAVTSYFGNGRYLEPSFSYLVFKFALFAGLVGCIAALGRPKHGTSIKATKPDALLTLRAFACVLVLVGHYFIVTFESRDFVQGFPAHPFSRLLVGSPWAGVWMFFTLSGYLMGKGFHTGRYDVSRGGLSNFFRNRALRILPVYIAVVLLCSVLVSRAVWQKEYLWIFSEYVTFDFKGNTPIYPHGPAWTISTEVQFYFLAPFMALGIGRMNWRQCVAFIAAFPVAIMLLLAAIPAIATQWLDYVYTPMLSNIAFFACGMAMNAIVSHARENFVLRRQAATIAGLLLIPAFYLFVSLLGSYTIMVNVMGGGYVKIVPILTLWFSCAAILLFEGSRGALSPGLTALVRRTEIFGVLTYCIYLAHEPIYVVARPLLPATISLRQSMILFPALTLAILVTAYALYWLIEKRFDRLRFGHERLKEVGLGVVP